MERHRFNDLMEEYRFRTDMRSIQEELAHLSQAGQKVVHALVREFEWKSGWLHAGPFDHIFGHLTSYRKAFRAMPEAAEMVEDLTWRLLHTEYWRFYRLAHQRVFPMREHFHQHYFVTLPHKRVLHKSPVHAPLPLKKLVKARPKPTAQRGVVYLLLAQGTARLKIGRTGTGPGRLASLKTASPFPLQLLRRIETTDAVSLETLLHRRYRRYRVHLEWFELPPDILAALLLEPFSEEAHP